MACLYAVTRDIQAGLSIDELCRQTVEHLIPAMQFPEITVPVIELRGKRFTTKNYQEGLSPGLQAQINIQGEAFGLLRVFYLESRPFLLPEEQELVDGVAKALSVCLDGQKAETALRESEAKYRLLVNQIPAVVYKWYGGWRSEFFDNKIQALTGYPKEAFDSRG